MVDVRVKERLTGAIILVALLVLLVPELLSGPGPAATASPSSAEGQQQMRSYTIDLADETTSQRSAAVVAAPNPVPAVPEPIPAASPTGASSDAQRSDAVGDGAASAAPTDRATSAAVDTPSTEAPVRPAPSAPPARAVAPPEPRVASSERRTGRGWAVQVGSFASRENAERLARELKGKGFESHVSESSGNGKRLWRVRVGPEPDRASAVALGARLRAKGQSGSIVAMP
jgi:DedD protein